MATSANSSAALRDIDELLASVGLNHGRRKRIPAEFERQPVHPRKLQAARTQLARRVGREIEVLRPPLFAETDWLVGGFSTRAAGKSRIYSPNQSRGQETGELNLGFTSADSKENVLENRRLLIRAVTGDPAFPMVTLHQIHSSLTRRVTVKDAGEKPRFKGDGMMTSKSGLLLAIQTADCVPVLIADVKKRAVAAFHAGWRGTLKRIVENGIGRMRLEFGSRPKDLIAAIGPCIGQCCYAVGEEVRSEFLSQFSYAKELFCDVYDSDPVREKYPLLFLTARAPGHSNIGPSLHLDLVEANRRQLIDAELRPGSISVLGECTSCRQDRYFSYRAANGFTGRMLSVIGIRK